MTSERVLQTFELKPDFANGKDKEAKEVFSDAKHRLVEIKLQNGACLPKHKAVEPITVLCLSGTGIFRAGADLEEEQKLQTGTLITLKAGVEHAVFAEPNLHLLVTKFKD